MRRELVLSAAVAGILIASSPARAGGGGIGCPGCATEWTQIANNIELVGVQAKEIQQVAQQAQMVIQGWKQLEKGRAPMMWAGFDPRVRDMLMAFRTSKTLYEKFDRIAKSGISIKGKLYELKWLIRDIKRLDEKMGGRLIKGYGNLSKKEQERLDNVQKSMGEVARSVDEDIRNLKTDIDGVNEITSSVSGLRYNAIQMVKLRNVLLNIQKQSAISMKLRAEAKRNEQMKKDIREKMNATATWVLNSDLKSGDGSMASYSK